MLDFKSLQQSIEFLNSTTLMAYIQNEEDKHNDDYDYIEITQIGVTGSNNDVRIDYNTMFLDKVDEEQHIIIKEEVFNKLYKQYLNK